MKYQFTLKTNASELWQMSMYGIYGSILGMTNVVFTVAMILLTYRFFSESQTLVKCLLILSICIFPIFQPVLIYMKAKKQAKVMIKEVQLSFDDQGIHVAMDGQKSDIDWSSVRGITKKPTLMVIYTSSQHGYVLSNKVLGDQKNAFYRDIVSIIEKKNAS